MSEEELIVTSCLKIQLSVTREDFSSYSEAFALELHTLVNNLNKVDFGSAPWTLPSFYTILPQLLLRWYHHI